MTMITGTPVLDSVFPYAETGKVPGINFAFVCPGPFMGPFVVGILTKYSGWRSVLVYLFVIRCTHGLVVL